MSRFSSHCVHAAKEITDFHRLCECHRLLQLLDFNKQIQNQTTKAMGEEEVQLKRLFCKYSSACQIGSLEAAFCYKAILKSLSRFALTKSKRKKNPVHFCVLQLYQGIHSGLCF